MVQLLFDFVYRYQPSSVIFLLIYFLVLVFQLFFSFSFVFVLQYFFVLILVLPVIKHADEDVLMICLNTVHR